MNDLRDVSPDATAGHTPRWLRTVRGLQPPTVCTCLRSHRRQRLATWWRDPACPTHRDRKG